MNDDQIAERNFLRLASERGKFAISVTANMSQAAHDALERLQLRDWIRLIDVSPIATQPGLYRIFMLCPPALVFLRETAN